MDSPSSALHDIITETSYFRQNIENLMRVLQPSFYCINMIVKVLLHGPDGSGKRLLAKTASKNLNMKFCEERIADLFDENIVGTEKKVRSAIVKTANSAPCLLYLSGYELFCNLEDPDLNGVEHCLVETLDMLCSREVTQPIILICATNDFIKVYNSPLSSIFQHIISVTPPSPHEADEILLRFRRGTEVRLTTLGEKEAIFEGADNRYLGNLIDALAREEVGISSKDSGDEAEGYSRRTDLGTRWLDVGGLNDVKREIIDTVQMSLEFPQLKNTGLRRTGVLLYGPPGTGKTLLAKAVATECSLSFINVKGPELLNEYVGQSENNIRELFQRARESSPSVIFFDELDSLAPNRGQAGDSGGVMDRIVSQILAEMDGICKSDSVFVIGATNRVDLVDSSLLRPGRFDKVLEVPIPCGREDRMQILIALTRRMKLSEDVDLEEVESLAPANMTGADFQGLCSRAFHKTFDRCIEQIESGCISEEDAMFVTEMQDFLDALLP